MSTPYILVVDDEPDIRNLVQEILAEESYEVATADGGEAARTSLRARRPDLVLLDIWMPDVDGITLLKEWMDGERRLPAPVIIMSGHGTVETAVEAIRLGAYDFIEKPLSLAKLLLTVKNALATDRLQRENQGLKRFAPMVLEPIGKSPVMSKLREQARRIAQHDTWVLITGEAGAGKRTIARYLHNCSARRDGPFIEIGGGSIAQQNAATELFGAEEDGRVHYGRLEQANGGILFLDEVADMDLGTQGRLLSALESRSFLRLGGSEPITINVRVIAATQSDLAQQVRAGKFREDLYYYLNVVPLHVPPLREHRTDVPDLLNYYLNVFINQDNLPYRRFSMAAQNRLRNHAWLGNVRELKNLVQRLLILGNGESIELEEVEAALGAQTVPTRTDVAVPVPFDQPLREAREQFERAYLTYQLQECEGSIGRLAKQVGMERTHLYRKLRSLGIELRKTVNE